MRTSGDMPQGSRRSSSSPPTLSKDPAQRYARAEELLADLHCAKASAGLPVTSPAGRRRTPTLPVCASILSSSDYSAALADRLAAVSRAEDRPEPAPRLAVRDIGRESAR